MTVKKAQKELYYFTKINAPKKVCTLASVGSTRGDPCQHHGNWIQKWDRLINDLNQQRQRSIREYIPNADNKAQARSLLRDTNDRSIFLETSRCGLVEKSSIVSVRWDILDNGAGRFIMYTFGPVLWFVWFCYLINKMSPQLIVN